ncbi:hypothetical protein NXC24_PC01967 (plasmid) [Rhizobium sp. NXC24]|nr:hypothetical protein NXC24_PC01967 [Rhizobium sp. NXC24]
MTARGFRATFVCTSSVKIVAQTLYIEEALDELHALVRPASLKRDISLCQSLFSPDLTITSLIRAMTIHFTKKRPNYLRLKALFYLYDSFMTA